MAVGWLGLHAGAVIPLDRSQLDRGLQYTSGRECLPLPICIGQTPPDPREPPSPARSRASTCRRAARPASSTPTWATSNGSSPSSDCPTCSSSIPGAENDYCGFDKFTLASRISPAILVADILVEIEQVLRVVGAAGSVERLQDGVRAVHRLGLDRSTSSMPSCPASSTRLAALPRTRDPSTCPRVVVTGDFFTRFSPFFMEGVREPLRRARHHPQAGRSERPGALRRLPRRGGNGLRLGNEAGLPGDRQGVHAGSSSRTGRSISRNWLAYQAERRSRDYYRGTVPEDRSAGRRITRTFAPLFEKAAEHVSPTIFGEVIPTVEQGPGGREQGLRRDHPHRPVQLPAVPDLRGDPQAALPAARGCPS